MSATLSRNTRMSRRPLLPLRGSESDRTSSSSESGSEEQQMLVLRTPRKQKPADEVGNSVTPPKQKRLDCGENAVPLTPSEALKKLSLSADRKQLNSPYKSARKALHSTFKTDMPGREKELEELRGFIKNHANNETSGTLYISGPPGTGKTASLDMLLQQDDISSKMKKIYINCTSIKSSGTVYSKIAAELGVKTIGRTEKSCLSALERFFSKPHEMTLLVLDEIDQLESKNQSVLYTIFEWPANPSSKLILIGIANALDLTDRILPRLQSNCALKPKLMHFAPYTKQQIVAIFTSRLKAAGVLGVFSPPALQMLAGKVAAVSGDVRRALDVGRRVVEIVQQNAGAVSDKEVLASVENFSENHQAAAKPVELIEVVNALNSIYSTTQNLQQENSDSGAFPLQQKIVICSLLLLYKKSQHRNVTVGKLHDIYKRVCNKRNILAVDQAEFVGLCSLIETKGVIRITGKKEPRLAKVTLEWDEEEVAGALKDKQLLSSILQEDGCMFAKN